MKTRKSKVFQLVNRRRLKAFRKKWTALRGILRKRPVRGKPVVRGIKGKEIVTQRTGPRRWKITGASVVGTRHLQQDCECEDAYGSFGNGELVCIAVADGAGSAPRSATGSALAVRAALSTFEHSYKSGKPITGQTSNSILTYAFRCAAKALIDEGVRLSIPASDLACTLILVISDSHFVAAGQIGDGAVVVGDHNSKFVTLSVPTNGEYANETSLLGFSPGAEPLISAVKEYEVSNISVCTDGIQRLALHMASWKPHPGFFRPLLNSLVKLSEEDGKRLLAEFLQSPRVAARTDDDKTLIVAQIQ